MDPLTICLATEEALLTFTATRSANRRFESLNKFFAELDDADAIFYQYYHRSNNFSLVFIGLIHTLVLCNYRSITKSLKFSLKHEIFARKILQDFLPDFSNYTHCTKLSIQQMMLTFIRFRCLIQNKCRKSKLFWREAFKLFQIIKVSRKLKK